MTPLFSAALALAITGTVALLVLDAVTPSYRGASFYWRILCAGEALRWALVVLWLATFALGKWRF